MNHMESEIYDDISSSDTVKQIAGLSKLNFYWINQGKDPSLFYSSIIKVLHDTDSKTARIQCYNALRSMKAVSSTDFSIVIPLIVKDLGSDDVEVVIAILKVLPNVNEIFTELLLVGNTDFGHLVKHNNQSVRKTALDTLVSLLFYKKSVLNNYKSFVQTGWDLIVERLLEEPVASVYTVSFQSVSNLYSEISRSVSHSDECDSNNLYRRQQLTRIADGITVRLVDHFDLIFERAQQIDQLKRHVVVNTLTYLADAISRSTVQPYWPSGGDTFKLTPLRLGGQNPQQKTTPQTIVPFLVDYYISLLDSTSDSLVFSCGKAILDLLLTQKNQHHELWINPVVTAFIGLLKREGITMNPLPILLALMSVFPMLPDDLLLQTLLKVLPSIKSISDSNQRLSYLIKTFELIIDRHVTSNGKSTLFTPLMQDPALLCVFQDDTSSFREEIVISMVASHHNILSKYLYQDQEQSSGSDSFSSTSSSGSSTSGKPNSSLLYFLHQAALNITEICLRCLMWSDERISALEYCLRFVDWLCRVTLNSDSPQVTKLVGLLRSEILEQVHMIPSDYICLQSVFLLCTHLLKSPANKVYEQSDASLIIGVIRRRFLFLDNQPKYTQFNGSIREMLMGVSQYAKTSPAQLHSLSGLWLGAIESLYLLGLNIPSSETSVLRTLDDILSTYPHNKSVFNRARFVKRLLFSSSSTPNNGKYSTIRSLGNLQQNPIDFHYCIPLEILETSNGLRSTLDIFAYECKKAITGLAGQHYGSSIRDKPSRETLLVSGVSDPVWVEISHTTHPTLHTVTVYLTVTNVIQFTIKNLTVIVGLQGHLDMPYTQTQCKYQIPKLLPDKPYQIDIPIQVTGLDQNQVSVTLIYNQPCGVGELEQQTIQVKRPKAPSSGINPNANAGSTSTGSSTNPSQSPPISSTISTSPTSTTSPISSNNANSINNQLNSASRTTSATSALAYANNASNTVIIATPIPNDVLIGPGANIPNGISHIPPGIIFAVPFETHLSDYPLDWNQFLIPFKYNNHQFLQQWPRFEAVYQQDIVFEGYVTPQLIAECFDLYPFHQVEAGYFGNSNFQFAYSSSTWFNDQFCFIVSGMEKPTENNQFINPTYFSSGTNSSGGSSGNLGSSTSTTPSLNASSHQQYKVIHSRFEFRSSSSSVLAVFQNILDQWIYKIPRATDNFIVRKLLPGEESLYTITKIHEPTTTNQSLTPDLKSNSIQEELQLLLYWKEKKSLSDSSKKLYTQLALDQDFY